MFSEFLQRKKILVLRACALALALAALLAVRCAGASAALTYVSLEQVRARKPEVSVYCYDNGDFFDGSYEADAYLDGEQLTYKGAASGAERGTSYIFLVDESASIKQSYSQAVKSALLSFADDIGKNDTITIITFGDEVAMLAQGAASRAELESAVEQITCKDQQTHLYEAIQSGIAYADASENASRQVMLIVSDGIQSVVSAGATLKEAEEELEKANLPIYALCVDYAGKAAQEEFGSFARKTGGGFYTFKPDTASAVLAEAAEKLGACKVLTFECKDNVIDGNTHTLLLKFRKGDAEESYTKQVLLSSWQPDTTAPRLVSANYDPDNHTAVVGFSEPVAGADTAAAYKFVSSDGAREYFPSAVSKSSDTEYVLSLPQDMPNGDYTLTLSNIADVSMESNALAGGETLDLTVDNPEPRHEPEPRQEPAPAPGRQDDPAMQGVLAVAMLTLVAVVGGIIFFVVHSRSQTAAQAQPVNNNPRVEVHRVDVTPGGDSGVEPGGVWQQADARLTVGFLGGKDTGKTQEFSFYRSSIWGRSGLSNVQFPHDGRVSKQHCVFEVRNGMLYLSDLESSNGTFVNGVRLSQPTAVHEGDTVRIGNTEFKILGVELSEQ